MAGAFQIIREQMPQFLDEPHAREFRDVAGALIPTTPQDVALSALFGPGRAIRSAGAAFLAAQPTEANAGGPVGALARLATRSGPDLRRWLDEAIEFARNRRTHDAGEAERIERIAKELPVVPRVFSPQAVAEKAVFADPNSLVGMTPRQFEKTAWPLDVEAVRPYIEHYKDLVRADQFVEPAAGLFTPRGLASMREKGFKGFSDVPFLQYRQMHDDAPMLAQRATGHEGRHRNKAIEELFGPDEPSLVHMIPGVNQSALSRITSLYPEVENVSDLMYRQPVDLDRKLRFAGGGLAKFAGKQFDNYVKWYMNKMKDQNFIDWFSNSKAKDMSGRPAIMYHGTNVDNAGEFIPSESGLLGQGIYMTPDVRYANAYATGEGSHIVPLVAALRKPLEITASKTKEPPFLIAEHPAMQDYFWTKGQARRWAREQMDDWAGIGDPEFPDMLRGAGFDSVILRSPTGRIEEATTLYPSNVKSAIDSQFGRGHNIRFAEGGLVDRLKSFGFSPEDVDYALDRFEEEREYLPHRGATNYESRPERYMIMAPHKIVPKEEWKYGSSIGGTHSFLEGIQVPNRSWNWVLPEVLTHEAQHANVGALPLEEITSREEIQKGILSKLMDYVKPLHPAKYPAGVTGRELVQELAPELVAAEGYLPAGQSLIHSELGQRIFQSPEEKLWYMSRRYPPMRDPEVKNGYLDAITGAAPR